MGISEIAIRRPVFTSMVALCMVVLGAWACSAWAPTSSQT